MFCFRKKRNDKTATGIYFESAKLYLKKHYIDTLPQTPVSASESHSEIRFSVRDSVDNDLDLEKISYSTPRNNSSVKYSYDIEPLEDSNHQVKSDTNIKRPFESSNVKDNYNQKSVKSTMKNFRYTASSTLLDEIEQYTNATFVDKLIEHVRLKKLKDSYVYRTAQIDRRLYSKIISDKYYKPSKDTCIALAIALELTLSEAEDFLSRAGYTFSHSSKRDVIIEYFFHEKIYDLIEINDVLYKLDQKLIGR